MKTSLALAQDIILRGAIAVLLLAPGILDAALVTIQNTNDQGTGANAVATSSFVRFDNTDSDSTNDGYGVIGKMNLGNGSIAANFNARNVAAIQSAFVQFSTPFTLDTTGLAGAFLDSRSGSTKASENGFGGSLIYVWIYKGATIATATEHLIIGLPNTFPTDPESGASLSANAFVRPTDSAQVIVGGLGNYSFDYEAGSGPLPGYNTVPVVPEPAATALVALGFLYLGTHVRRRRNSHPGQDGRARF